MSKIYYKVLRQSWISATRKGLISATPRGMVTEYKVGEFVSSPFPQTPLCVFETYQDANNFVYGNFSGGYKIFTCKIKQRCKYLWLPDPVHLKSILSKIKNKQKFMHLTKDICVTGTVCAKQVMLLQDVTGFFLCSKDLYHQKLQGR